MLLTLGYLLRYPTWTIFDFRFVTEDSLRSFYVVDVLHLIGAGLLILLFILFISEKFKLNEYFTFGIISLLIIFLTPGVYKINWIDITPTPLAAYLYPDTGSLFPLFPWLAYLVAGGILGNYLAKHPMAFKTASFSLVIGILGAGLLLSSMIFDMFTNELGYSD